MLVSSNLVVLDAVLVVQSLLRLLLCAQRLAHCQRLLTLLQGASARRKQKRHLLVDAAHRGRGHASRLH